MKRKEDVPNYFDIFSSGERRHAVPHYRVSQESQHKRVLVWTFIVGNMSGAFWALFGQAFFGWFFG